MWEETEKAIVRLLKRAFVCIACKQSIVNKKYIAVVGKRIAAFSQEKKNYQADGLVFLLLCHEMTTVTCRQSYG